MSERCTNSEDDIAHVPGAPFQPGDDVMVVNAVEADVYDVSEWIGKRGVVEYLDYRCGCGQTYPTMPMIGVRFAEELLEEFWPEELTADPGSHRRMAQ